MCRREARLKVCSAPRLPVCPPRESLFLLRGVGWGQDSRASVPRTGDPGSTCQQPLCGFSGSGTDSRKHTGVGRGVAAPLFRVGSEWGSRMRRGGWRL